MNASTVERVYFNDPAAPAPRPFLAGPVGQVGLQACAADNQWAMLIAGPLWDAYVEASRSTDREELSERGRRALRFRDRQWALPFGLA